jgi:hypothetical protein
MTEQYIGSQQAFEDSVNDHYDELERINNDMQKQIEKEVYKQMEDDYWHQLEYEANKLNSI